MADETTFYASFARGRWNESAFRIVKSPRFSCLGSFEQRDDHIVNRVPTDKSAEELLCCAGSYCALVRQEKCGGDFTVSAHMSFDHRMAPLIVLAPELGIAADGRTPEFREHWEVVLYDQGMNVWHHLYRDGKPSWYKRAWLTARFEPRTVYELAVSVRHTEKGPVLAVCGGGHAFGCALPPECAEQTFYPGVIACEGVNRFYDFRTVAE